MWWRVRLLTSKGDLIAYAVIERTPKLPEVVEYDGRSFQLQDDCGYREVHKAVARLQIDVPGLRESQIEDYGA